MNAYDLLNIKTCKKKQKRDLLASFHKELNTIEYENCSVRNIKPI